MPLGNGAQQQGKCLIILTHPEIHITEADMGLSLIHAYLKINSEIVILLCQIAPKIFKICDYISLVPFTMENDYYPHLPSSIFGL